MIRKEAGMKRAAFIVIIGLFGILLSGCTKETEKKKEDSQTRQEQDKEEGKIRVVIKAGGQEFSAVFDENETAQAIVRQFPVTMNMKELNGNEKYCYLSENYPMDERMTGQIRKGDLMLYGADCFVLFYDTFSTSYQYTPVGHIENPDGLEKALGKGTVEVSFAIR